MKVKVSLKVNERVVDYQRDVLHVYGPRDVVSWPITRTLWVALQGLRR